VADGPVPLLNGSCDSEFEAALSVVRERRIEPILPTVVSSNTRPVLGERIRFESISKLAESSRLTLAVGVCILTHYEDPDPASTACQALRRRAASRDHSSGPASFRRERV